ncbi:MAG: hypothetical protein GKS01_04525 [Alphaproteobacteria bacterium]|nr:hypothetical protein [Alphaproteobacteria bacterium]
MCSTLCGVLLGCAVEPKPIAPKKITERTQSDIQKLRATAYIPTGPISLEKAIARAIAFNMQGRVKQIEREIADAELRTKSFEMLPPLQLDASRKRKDKALSSSDERVTTTASAGLTWNILDLGVSYARAKQQANNVLIAHENQRKALQDIIREVRTAYWRAAGAERLMGRIQTIAENIKIAMRESRAMELSGANDIATSVAYRREIVDSVRQALTFQRDLRESRARLAELLNIKPGTRFQLANTQLAAAMPSLPMTLAQMEQHALESRPELRIEDYNDRISQWQAREALFDMLPGVNLSAGGNYDSDRFNLTPNWINTGFQLGMNLFGLFAGSSKIDTAEKSGELARRQRLAVTLAVMTQTHMAYIQFRGASQQMRLAREVARADRRLSQLVASDKDFVNTNYFEAVRLKTRRLLAEIDEHQAQVELVTAHSDVMHAIGLDVFPPSIPTNDLDALTGAVRKITARWETKGTDIESPADTPLDLLVNAMLKNGEGPSNRRKSKNRTFEVKLKPKSDRPAQKAKTLNNILPAAGPPEKQSVAKQIAAIKPKQAKPSVKLGPFHVVQLGAFRSAPKAKTLHRVLTASSEATLHGVDVRIIERQGNGGDALHYVETASIPDRTSALELCQTLKGLGHDCVAITRQSTKTKK